MGLSLVHSRGCVGVESPLITVEVHLSGGLPLMHLVGLPETAVRESKDRVRAACLNSNFRWPQSRITISLGPAELPKEGGGFDLPIALGILAADNQVPDTVFGDCEFLGELSLNGDLRSVRGVLPAAIRARDSNRTLVIPTANAAEAALVKGGKQLHGHSLLDIAEWLHGRNQLAECKPDLSCKPPVQPDLCDVIGLPGAKRALEVAAAGCHNILMLGPPGTGKTLLASRLPGILPPMTESESLEAASLASVSQAGLDHRSWGVRPFRTPHHSCSNVALAGGGSRPRPGEISLAHNGILFLDELPEFGRHALEVLREPLESGRIVISRAARQATFPARFQLITAMNPCPCGMAGDNSGRCSCSAEQIQRYRGKISGPLLDRIDIQVEVMRPDKSILSEPADDIENSAAVRQRVIRSRARQLARAGKPNALLDNDELSSYCHIGGEQLGLLEMAAERLFLSPRACHRILKVSRTIADLDQADDITCEHIAEAIAFRRLQISQIDI
ncbi:MAG: YifB family Mg chelatase-like AAA ATPase [Gammaproteobacteria bacterium]|nr:MAG: YifB family Mg chelatase-like AAA ATPase [Gammaproteobacteria bacterium]